MASLPEIPLEDEEEGGGGSEKEEDGADYSVSAAASAFTTSGDSKAWAWEASVRAASTRGTPFDVEEEEEEEVTSSLHSRPTLQDSRLALGHGLSMREFEGVSLANPFSAAVRDLPSIETLSMSLSIGAADRQHFSHSSLPRTVESQMMSGGGRAFEMEKKGGVRGLSETFGPSRSGDAQSSFSLAIRSALGSITSAEKWQGFEHKSEDTLEEEGAEGRRSVVEGKSSPSASASGLGSPTGSVTRLSDVLERVERERSPQASPAGSPRSSVRGSSDSVLEQMKEEEMR